MYREINPSLELKESVDAFWVFSNNKIVEKFKICPDACTDLIFDLNQDIGYLSAPMTKYQRKELKADSNLIGIRFKSENFGSLLGIPLNELKNSTIEIAELIPKFDLGIISELKGTKTILSKVIQLEVFIERVFNQSFERRDELIISVAKRIRLLKGNLNLESLATSYHISLRQLQRRFKYYIGITMKEFSNIIRFKNAKINIKTNPHLSFMEIAFNMGYYDHSHMNYEFNRIVGESPSQFR